VRSCGQDSRFSHPINTDKVFGTHRFNMLKAFVHAVMATSVVCVFASGKNCSNAKRCCIRRRKWYDPVHFR
jgi:hypothetical protein